jgi:hypothetical protein
MYIRIAFAFLPECFCIYFDEYVRTGNWKDKYFFVFLDFLIKLFTFFILKRHGKLAKKHNVKVNIFLQSKKDINYFFVRLWSFLFLEKTFNFILNLSRRHDPNHEAWFYKKNHSQSRPSHLPDFIIPVWFFLSDTMLMIWTDDFWKYEIMFVSLLY